MPQDLEVKAGYDKRFGTVGFDVHTRFFLPVKRFFEQLGIDPNDFAALLEDQYQWTEGENDIEPARHRLLEETDWQGKTCLDVGGFDGFAAAIALKGGAKRAVCLDNHQYEHYGWEEIKKPGVEYVKGDPRAWTEPADVVIAYNLLYHTHHPWQMLAHLRRLTNPGGEMLLCSLFRYHQGAWMYVYEPRECNSSDETVFFGPSLEALERLLKHTGWLYERYALTHDRVLYRCKPAPDWVEKHPEPGD